MSNCVLSININCGAVQVWFWLLRHRKWKISTFSTTILTFCDVFLQFYYHSPQDVLDVSFVGFLVPENTMKVVKVGALTTYTTPEARTLRIEQRKCRFPDENNLRISPVYTFNFCRMECRMRIARKKCDCIPHFYRKTGNSQHFCESREVPHAATIYFMPSATPRKLSRRWCERWGSRFLNFLPQFQSSLGPCNLCLLFYARSRSRQKSLLASSCSSVHPSLYLFICSYVRLCQFR